MSCYHDTSNKSDCHWLNDEEQDITLDYDIWLVNGHPFMKHINPFEHQFSFENHDIFEMYLAFFIVYTFLVPIQLYALSKQKHMLPLILTTCMCMEYVGVIFNFIHVFKFAFDGYGVDLLKVTGNFIDMIAQCLFMLLLLLIVKGWTITRMNLGWKGRTILFTVWGTYTVANLALFIWNQVRFTHQVPNRETFFLTFYVNWSVFFVKFCKLFVTVCIQCKLLTHNISIGESHIWLPAI